MSLRTALLVCTFAFYCCVCEAYTQVSSFEGRTFFDNFRFFSSSDPSNGFVKYVGRTAAASNGYVQFVRNKYTKGRSWAYIGVDSKNTAYEGRPSVRMISKDAWTHGLFIADIRSVPTGCALWPALWLVNPGIWPGSTGEIDIFESVHEMNTNTMTLHTCSGCVVSNESCLFSGHMQTSNCDVYAPDQASNVGCSIEVTEDLTAAANYSTAGSEFNRKGGGVYALEWTSSGVSIFFFPRGSIPRDITTGRPDPSAWEDLPLARFQGPDCTFDQHLSNLSLVINTDMCGDWAGQTWESSGCAARTGVASCNDFVANNPQSFDQAFWLIDSVKVYQNQ